LLEQRGGAFYSEAATQLLAALYADSGEALVVDTYNNGVIAGLADDDVVELPARVDASGATPLPQPPLSPELLGLVQHMAAYERIAARAARTGDNDLARMALMTNPLVREYALAGELLGQLREA
jgi:6-phospho-beta-glucosidase